MDPGLRRDDIEEAEGAVQTEREVPWTSLLTASELPLQTYRNPIATHRIAPGEGAV